MRFNQRQSAFGKSLIMLAMALVITACAAVPKIYTSQDPDARFSTYNTYGFLPGLSTDKSEYKSLLSKFLKSAAGRELEKRGYILSDSPDLTVNFYVKTKEKITQTAGSGFGGYYGYRTGYYGTWDTYGGYSGYGGRIRQQTEGTLTIDLVDSAGNQLVWEGSITGIVSEADQENLEEAVNNSVARVFARYPHRAGYHDPAGQTDN